MRSPFLVLFIPLLVDRLARAGAVGRRPGFRTTYGPETASQRPSFTSPRRAIGSHEQGSQRTSQPDQGVDVGNAMAGPSGVNAPIRRKLRQRLDKPGRHFPARRSKCSSCGFAPWVGWSFVLTDLYSPSLTRHGSIGQALRRLEEMDHRDRRSGNAVPQLMALTLTLSIMWPLSPSTNRETEKPHGVQTIARIGRAPMRTR